MDNKKTYRKWVQIAKTELKKQKKPWRNEDIADTLRYSRPYFSSLMGAAGKVTSKHLEDFSLRFPFVKENQTFERDNTDAYDVGKIDYGSDFVPLTANDHILELKKDKEVLRDAIQLSLNAIQRSQKDELDFLQKNEIHSEMILRTMARIVDHLGIENHDRKGEGLGSGKLHGIVEKGKPSGSRGKG